MKNTLMTITLSGFAAAEHLDNQSTKPMNKATQ